MGGFAPNPISRPRRTYNPTPTLADVGAPYVQGRNVEEDLHREQKRAAGRGDIYNNLFLQNLLPGQLSDEERYGGLADTAYENLARQPGYSPDETGDILRPEDYADLGYTQGEANDLYWTGDEQGGVLGDPYSTLDYLNPEQMYSIINAGAGDETGVLNQGRGRVEDIIYDPSLAQDANYAGTQRGIVGDLSSQYPLTDAEIEDATQQAVRTAKRPFGEAYSASDRVAAASGTATPMAMAALKNRLNTEAAIAASDAATQAKLQGLAQQREQRKSMAELELGVESGIESGRLGAEQWRSGLQTDTERGLTQAEQDIISRRTQGQAEAEQWQQGQRTGIAGQAEQSSSERNAARANQRTGAAATGSRERYDRGMDLATTQSGLARDVAQQRLKGEEEGRGFLTGSRQYTGGRAADTASTGTQAMESAGRTGASTAASQTSPDWWGRIMDVGEKVGAGIASFEHGGIAGLDGIETIIVGEKEPELIVPLSDLRGGGMQSRSGANLEDSSMIAKPKPKSGPPAWKRALSAASKPSTSPEPERKTRQFSPEDSMEDWLWADRPGSYEHGGMAGMEGPEMIQVGEKEPEIIIPLSKIRTIAMQHENVKGAGGNKKRRQYTGGQKAA